MPAPYEWTESRLQLLRDGFPTRRVLDLAADLCCSDLVVYKKAAQLGLKRAPRPPRPLSPLRLAIVGHLVAAGARGTTLVEICEKDEALNQTALYSTLYSMAKEGHAFKPVGLHKPMRWFSTAQQAQAWTAARCRPAPGRSPTVIARQGKSKLFREQDAPARTTAATRHIVAPQPPAHRFEVRKPVVGGFSTSGIGQYQEAPSAWVAAMIGGAA